MLCEENQRSREELFKNRGIIIIFQTLCVDIFKISYCDFCVELYLRSYLLKNKGIFKR